MEQDNVNQKQNWHNLSVDETVARLSTNQADGLSETEANRTADAGWSECADR